MCATSSRPARFFPSSAGGQREGIETEELFRGLRARVRFREACAAACAGRVCLEVATTAAIGGYCAANGAAEVVAMGARGPAQLETWWAALGTLWARGMNVAWEKVPAAKGQRWNR